MLSDALIEKVEQSTVKANRAVEHFFDVTSQQGPLMVTLEPVQMTGTFKNLDLLISTAGVPDMSSFQYRQECSLEKGGVITIEDECFHPARYYVKVMVTSARGAATSSNMYDFLQYLIEFRTGAWRSSVRAVTDSFGRKRWEAPESNNGCWIAPDGLTYRGTFMHGLPMTGSGVWKSDCENKYEGEWENGQGSGTITGPNDEEYEGDWLDGWPTHGKGTFTGQDKNTYMPDEGEWRGGAGEGSIVHKTGATFWGSWEGREPLEGRGKWISESGQVFEGNWSEGEGMGMISSDDGEVVFEGEWRGEIPFKGKGAWRDKDGNMYEGDWRNGILYRKDLSKVGGELSMTEGETEAEEDGAASEHSASASQSPSVASAALSKASSKDAGKAPSRLALVPGIKPKAGHRLVTGRRFEGEWREGKPWTGLGMFRGQMGHVFDGTWKKGRPFEGKGAFLSEEGWVLDGEIRNGRVVQATGKWRDTEPLPNIPDDEQPFDGRVFEGEWKDGVPFSGKGEWWDGHNHIYRGEWASLEGAGTVECLAIPEVSDGGEYIGKWRGGLPLSGDGYWVDLDGYTFDGTWNNASPYTGSGEWNYADNLYSGKWEEGKGAGRITGAAGSRYKGTWRGWRPWLGQGEFIDPEGHRFNGDFMDGAPSNGTGDWKSTEGHVVRGDMRNGGPWNAEGSFKDQARNCVYEGKWVESKGSGNIYGEGEEVFHGNWREGIPYSGKGSWRSKHMKVLEGEWEDGEGAGIVVGLKKGERFEGAWMDGDGAPVSGTGRWFSEEGFGNMYDGEWKDTRGNGRIIGPEGQIFKGDWWNLSPYKGKGTYRGPDGFDFQGSWKNGTRTWRGRKWADAEAVKPEFKIRRSKFLAGRMTADVRAREAASLAGDFAKGENRKTADEAVAAKLLIDAEKSEDATAADDAPTNPMETTQTSAISGVSSILTSKSSKAGDEKSALDAGPPVPNLDGTDTSKMDATERKLHALELAKQCGALSEKQYERAKRRVMRKTEDGSGSESDESQGESRRRRVHEWTEQMIMSPPSNEPSDLEPPEPSRHLVTPDGLGAGGGISVSSPPAGPLVTFDDGLGSPTSIGRTASGASSPSASPLSTRSQVQIASPVSSEDAEQQRARRWGQPVRRGAPEVRHVTTQEEQARRDEKQWELEAALWKEHQKAPASPPKSAPKSDLPDWAMERDAAEPSPQKSVQLRYLRRGPPPDPVATDSEPILPPVPSSAQAPKVEADSQPPRASGPEPEFAAVASFFDVEGRRARSRGGEVEGKRERARGGSAPANSEPGLDLFGVEGRQKKRAGGQAASALPAAAADLFAVERRKPRAVPDVPGRVLSPSMLAKKKVEVKEARVLSPSLLAAKTEETAPRVLSPSMLAKKKVAADVPEMHRGVSPSMLAKKADDPAMEPAEKPPFTLMCTCEDEGLVFGAHKLSVKAHSVTALLGEIKLQLGIEKEPAAADLGLYLLDTEFEEYIALKSIEDLPLRAKVRLVYRPPSRVGSAASRVSAFSTGEIAGEAHEDEEAEATQAELVAELEESNMKRSRRSKKSSTSLSELRAVRNRLLESDPGMSLRIGPLDTSQRQVLAEAPGGALHALEGFQDAHHTKERNMLRKLQGRKSKEEEARENRPSSVEPLPAIDPRAQPRFEGEWQDNAPFAGEGRWLSPDGHLYAGSWRDGAPHTGDGSFKDKRGRVFDGHWKNGVAWHGEGEFSNEKGYVWSGRWKKGTGFGTIILLHKGKEECRFDGKWSAGAGPPHTGVGTWVDVRVGENAIVEGRKKLPPFEDTLDLSRRCEGQWTGGELHNGTGQWRSPLSMYAFDGEWVDGEGFGTYKKPGPDTRTVPGRWHGSMPVAEKKR